MFSAATSLPLSRHIVFSSTDMEEVVDSVSRSYCPHDLAPQHRRQAIQARHHRLAMKAVSLNYLQYGAEVKINPGAFGEFYMLEFPLSGQVELEYGGDRVVNKPGTAAIISPHKKLRSCWSSGCGEVMVKISRGALEASLAESLGSALKKPLEFTPLIDLSTPSGQAISQYVSFLLGQADGDGEVLAYDGTASAFEKALFNLLLTCQPHNYSEALLARRSPAVPYYVAKAKGVIDRDLQQDLQISDIVEACGVAERTLYEGFKRFLGVTPHSYLRNLRLERVREDLLESGATVRVTDVALKWGFTHLGRFSEQYYRRFGEKPSDTLRAK